MLDTAAMIAHAPESIPPVLACAIQAAALDRAGHLILAAYDPLPMDAPGRREATAHAFAMLRTATALTSLALGDAEGAWDAMRQAVWWRVQGEASHD